MIKLTSTGVYLKNGAPALSGQGFAAPADARRGTMAHKILQKHNRSGRENKLQLRFDKLISHDITYVGIIQTARFSGLTKFPMPYAMTNCHNSLCAVGGTINEDDHLFGLSAAQKYGGIYVPPNVSVIHTYAREALSRCGDMILGSDSHTRYGALGTMGVGEGGPELVKQLLNNTYDVDAPQVVLVYLKNAPKPGVGPHDVALALVGATFGNGFVKNKVMEFVGPGIKNLPIDFRCAIDVMTTETSCLSSIWETDEVVHDYYKNHLRGDDYATLSPHDGAYYDAMIEVDLAKVESMIALPFHPSNTYTIKDLTTNAQDILSSIEKENKGLKLCDKIVNGKVYAQQGVIAGCAGGLFDNLCDAAGILSGKSVGNGAFSLSVYPGSQPIMMEIARCGVMEELLAAGAIVKPAFCGPCFGAGDVPANNTLSIRHTTRNFPNREGSVPSAGQVASVALMDARSIAATAVNGGAITPATDLEPEAANTPYRYDGTLYEKRVYNGWGNEKPETELILGPNITDWPKMHPMSDDLLLELTAVIHDPVTTTDELIPSGETSSYRSNPLKLAEFALSRREPAFVGRSKAVFAKDAARREGHVDAGLQIILDKVGAKAENTAFGGCVYATKPGDGSAREQAASCQRVLGTMGNICVEYATKRYQSNLINWGILPFTLPEGERFAGQNGDYVFVPGIRQAVAEGKTSVAAKLISGDAVTEITLCLRPFTADETEILLEGCLMNYYAAKAAK